MAPIEQFIPAAWRRCPLIKKGISILGLRPKIKDVLAKGLALLIKNHVGPQMAQALAPRVAEAGLKMLGLETADPTMLGAEALVATLEDTIREVVELPDESLDEPLRLQAEMEHAFVDAAARYLPREILREEVAPFETDDEGAVWVAMPRVGRPRYRYRNALGSTASPSVRPTARCIVLTARDPSRERLRETASTPGRSRQRSTCTRRCPAPPGQPRRVRDRRPQETDEPLRTDEFETDAGGRVTPARPARSRAARSSIAPRPLPPSGHRLSRVAVPGCRCDADTVGWR